MLMKRHRCSARVSRGVEVRSTSCNDLAACARICRSQDRYTPATNDVHSSSTKPYCSSQRPSPGEDMWQLQARDITTQAAATMEIPLRSILSST
eukprot:6014947-Amphidinium_carterae.1